MIASGRHTALNQPNTLSLQERAARLTAGSALAVTAGLGVWSVANDTVDALKNRISFGIDSDAAPSDDFANLYDAAISGAAIIGATALVKTGGRQIRIGLSPRQQALAKIAYEGRSGGRVKKAAAASALPVIAASLIGYAGDIGNAVGGAQADAVGALVKGFPGDTIILSNSGAPELATTPILPTSVVEKLATQKKNGKYSVDVIPIRYSWDSAIREKDKKNASAAEAPKILSAVMSFPPEITGLRNADTQCKNIPVNAAAALGNIGDKFSMAGSTFTIAGSLTNSGPNVIPIAMNNDSYARCFGGNPDQPYNLVALRGDTTEVNRFLADSKVLNANSTTQHVKKSTLDDFIHETDRTSKNNANGIILIFAGAVSLAMAGMLAYKTKADFANNRTVNSMLSAGGMSNRDITRISTLRASREATLASLYAMPIVTGVDYLTAIGTPGAVNVAPNVGTFLTVLGVTKVIGRIATSAIAPIEMRKLTPTQRGV